MRNNEYFYSVANEILKSPKMRESINYIQHGNVSVYSHSLAVAIVSYKLAEELGLDVDRRSLIRGCLLHDFFLYDWHTTPYYNGWHGFSHPRTALDNAAKYFDINEKEADIIRHHMWPLTLLNVPQSKEAWIICAVDKYLSLQETFGVNSYNDRFFGVKK